MELPTPVIIPVVGVSHRQGVVRTLREGMHVLLRRDRANEFDANAIGFYTLRGELIGYVPRNLTERLIKQECERWGGVITEVLVGENNWGVRVKVTHSNVRDYPGDAPQPTYIPPSDIAEDVEAVVDGQDLDAYGKSGRRLGRVDDVTETLVRVREEGELRIYPRSAVQLRAVDADTVAA